MKKSLILLLAATFAAATPLVMAADNLEKAEPTENKLESRSNGAAGSKSGGHEKSDKPISPTPNNNGDKESPATIDGGGNTKPFPP